MPKVVIANDCLGKGYEKRKVQFETLIAELPERHLIELQRKTGVSELKARFESVSCVVICDHLESGEGIEELLGAYYSDGLPMQLRDQIADTTELPTKMPAIAIFADALDKTTSSISKKDFLASETLGNALWAHVLLHEIGHAVLPYGNQNYHAPEGLFLAEACADWFAWQTSPTERFIFPLITFDPQSPYRAYQKLLSACDKLQKYLECPERIITAFENPEFVSIDESFPSVLEEIAMSFSVFGAVEERLKGQALAAKARQHLQNITGRRK